MTFKFKYHGSSGDYLTKNKVYEGRFVVNENGDPVPLIEITNDQGAKALVTIHSFELLQ